VRKLRFALLLPLVQAPVALTAVLWDRGILGDRIPHDSPPLRLLLCYGINAPAFHLTQAAGLVESELLHGPSSVRVSGHHFPLEGILFPAFVFALWFFVGRAVDLGWSRTSRWLDATTIQKLALNALLLLYGTLSFLGGIYGTWDAIRRSLEFPAGTPGVELVRLVGLSFLYQGTLPALVLVWSLPLLIVPAQKLLGRWRSRGADGASFRL